MRRLVIQCCLITQLQFFFRYRLRLTLFADPQYSDIEMFEKGNFKRRKRMRRPHHPYKASSFRSWPAAAMAATADHHHNLMIRGAAAYTAAAHFGYPTVAPPPG